MTIGITKACGAANYLFWLEQLHPSIRETDDNRDNGPNGFRSLDMDKVHFSYPMRPDAPVLRGINLQVSNNPLPTEGEKKENRNKTTRLFTFFPASTHLQALSS